MITIRLITESLFSQIDSGPAQELIEVRTASRKTRPSLHAPCSLKRDNAGFTAMFLTSAAIE